VPPYQITTQVLNVEEWTPDIVKERQDTMLSTLGKLWDLNLDFPIVINIEGNDFIYNPNGSYWLSKNEKEAIWLQNESQDCPPDQWNGSRVIAQLDEDDYDSFFKELKQLDFFKEMDILDILLNHFCILDLNFFYKDDRESWYTEDEEYGIYLYNEEEHVSILEWSGEKIVTCYEDAVNNIEKFKSISIFRNITEIVFESEA